MFEYFLGIISPEELSAEIIRFRGQWRDFPPLRTEPHITLISPKKVQNPDQIPVTEFSRICDKFGIFQISVGQPAQFSDRVVYLSIYSERLQELHQLLTGSRAKFTPHLTLVNARKSVDPRQIEKALQLAVERFKAFQKEFQPEFVRIFLRQVPGSYQKFSDIFIKQY